MEVDHFTNGVTELSSNGFLNGTSKHATEPEDCDADMGGCRGGATYTPPMLLLRRTRVLTANSREFSPNVRVDCHRITNCFLPPSEVESTQAKRQLCGGSQAAIERMIHFGRELQSMSEHLRRECGKNSANKKMLKVKSVRLCEVKPLSFALHSVYALFHTKKVDLKL